VKTVRLYLDHTEHRDGKTIKHKAGEVVELPDDVADFIVRATLNKRASDQQIAENTPGTPERMRKHDL
jgi:hypothetical protein